MSSKKQLDALGTRLKAYEHIETQTKLIPGNPVYIRLDGRGFSKFTKTMQRPYDARMSLLMEETTKYLVKEFNAVIGYSQSDEISLVLENTYETPCMFEGKIQKLVSTLAASATAYFNANFQNHFDTSVLEFSKRLPTFDCRVINLPSKDEVANMILWRYLDAIKNSKQMAGHHYFSNKELFKLNTDQIVGKLHSEKNVNWYEYPQFFKEGVFIKRETYEKDLEDGATCTRSRIVSKSPTKPFVLLEHEDRIGFIYE